ncbi:unnamed protein product [Schistosoma mattheei]|uniref:Uncharacterized protein n=2 Tax=Schistosoma mattheei TaxID=31246 RepID=A0AA85B492_9TREM|nr:unnamed protein product [Schistosoma mattheei]
MYNLHYSVKPCQNKPLQYKFDKRYQDAHLKALAKMKSTVDTTAPKTFQIIHLNSKKDRDTHIKPIVKNTNENSSEYMETIISIVDSIIQRSIDYVQKLNSDSSKVDINHGNFENTQQHDATIGQGKSDESPEMIRNLITSIIQSSLYRVYEKDLLNKLSMKPENSESPYEINPTDYNYYDLEKSYPNESSYEINDEIILSDKPLPIPNIQWPTIEEFTPKLGLEKIEKYVKCWEISDKWLYCVDILPIMELKNETLHKYRVKFSLPSRRSPIPKSTVSVYFTLRISRIKPKNSAILVYYQVETFRSIQMSCRPVLLNKNTCIINCKFNFLLNRVNNNFTQ